ADGPVVPDRAVAEGDSRLDPVVQRPAEAVACQEGARIAGAADGLIVAERQAAGGQGSPVTMEPTFIADRPAVTPAEIEDAAPAPAPARLVARERRLLHGERTTAVGTDAASKAEAGEGAPRGDLATVTGSSQVAREQAAADA